MHIPTALIKVLGTLTMSLILATVAFGADDAPWIEPEQPKAKLDQAGLHLLDVRIVSGRLSAGHPYLFHSPESI